MDGCGRCCDPVVLVYGPDDLRRLAHRMDPAEVKWMRDDLTLIGRREGLRRADYLTAGGKTTYALGEDGVAVLWSYFYECRWFDRDTRSCTNYDGRPKVCSDYPWGGEKPDRRKALPPECGFLVDVGITPVPVTLGATRG